jgi:hypothetical protein
MKNKLLRLTSKEDVAFTKASKSDSDSDPLTNKEWDKVLPNLTRTRDRYLRVRNK